ncbi:MAG: hypothetical protein L3J09_01215 [Flavobacteriaceae bacterium]|nr:hypothetical protein [Flavobacteriaceae bacterium]
MKIFIKTSLILIFTSLLFSCETASKKPKNLIDFIPENTSVVFKIEDFETLKSDISNSSLISKFKTKNPYIFFSEIAIFSYLKPNSSSLICVSNKENNTYTFIGRPNEHLFNADSIPNITVEKAIYKGQSFQKVLINEQVIYTLLKDSVFVASNSQQNIKNLIDGKTEKTATFKKIFKVKNTQDFTAFFQVNEMQIGESLLLNFGSWAALDAEILPDALTASGVILANDSVPQLISVFKGLQPQRNEIAKVTPLDAKGVVSITFNDFEIFKNNLQKFRGIKNTNTDEALLFEGITEVGKISLPQGNAIVIKSIDSEITSSILGEFSTPKEPFKNVLISEFNKPNLFINNFATFTQKTTPKFVFKLEDFFIFSETEALAQQIINSYLSNNTLSKSTYYKKAMSQLSDESSLLIIRMNGNYSETISNLLKTEISDISFKKYPLVVLQFSYDRNFAHVNLVCKEAGATTQQIKTGKVSQIASIKLKNELLSDPIFFSNHRTGGKDMVVQDVKNQLHFISANGKTLWIKKLKNPIIGKIKEVDLLRNGKKQLAFVTQHYFYILDRTGRNVSPFPVKFNDDITQPLSVFDYDNNRKYRFIITQGKEILMLNSKGKTVKGFKFKKTQSDIVFAPQHFMISGKDYIVIAEENGKLNLLSRVGKSRVRISKTFNFSKTPPTIEAKKIVIISNDNTKNSIGINGKISSKKLNVTSYQFTVKGKTKVTLDDNLMRINGVLVELPFGIYTAPRITIVNRKTFISIIETQENKVYVYNKTGTLLSGFPVFGTSSIDLGDANKNGKINFITKGGTKEILLYEVR